MALAPDFMARLAGTYGDPSAFSELVFGTPLHGGQVRYVQNAVADTNFLLPGNSWGKTEFIARFSMYLAWFKDGPYRPTTFESWLSAQWKGLIASYNYPIAKESFQRLLFYKNSREQVAALITNILSSDPVHIELANGSRLDWGSLDGEGKLVEAARRNAIFVDEAGHITDLSYTFDSILYPRTMGVGGRIHLLGTPKPHSDPYLLEVYDKGRVPGNKEYYSQPGSVFENEFWPRNEQARVLRNSRYVKGWNECPSEALCDSTICWSGGDPAPDDNAWHPQLTPLGRQVFLGEFVIAGGYFFDRRQVERMFVLEDDLPPHNVTWTSDNRFHTGEWEENAGIWRLKMPGNEIQDAALMRERKSRLYLGAFDLGGNKLRKSKRKGSDPTVGFVIDYTSRPWRIVHYHLIEGGDMDWEQKYQTIDAIYRAYPMQYMVIDATGQIDSVQEALMDRGVEVEGVQFGGNAGNKKLDMLRNLQLCLELEWAGRKGLLRCPPIPKVKHELDNYVIPDDRIEQDCVMSLAMLTHHLAQWELPAAVEGSVY